MAVPPAAVFTTTRAAYTSCRMQRLFTHLGTRQGFVRHMSLFVTNSLPDTSEVIIGTHDGTFHCDESLAVAMLKMTDEFKNAVVVRTRNPDLLAKCNIVVDVGARYEPENNLLDHHQKEFQETMNTGVKQYKTRLSSAGLVYLHYGREVLRKAAPDVSDADLERLYDKVYENFMEHIDGIDNGVQQYSAADASVAVVQNYRVSTSLSARVSNLSPRWNQKADPESFNEGFVKAVALTGLEFQESVSFFADAWLPAANIVSETLQKRFDVHESGKIIRLDTFCPWQEHLFDVERSQNVAGEVLYCLFPDMNKGWRVRAVGVEGSAFDSRKSLPWKGLRDEALCEASGISGCVFIHASGFIGGNDTYEGALQMAIKALSA